MGMAIKSLTNSKKIINILNRYGNCCSYSILEELLTEATFSSTNSIEIFPKDILQNSKLCTSLVYNNFIDLLILY